MAENKQYKGGLQQAAPGANRQSALDPKTFLSLPTYMNLGYPEDEVETPAERRLRLIFSQRRSPFRRLLDFIYHRLMKDYVKARLFFVWLLTLPLAYLR